MTEVQQVSEVALERASMKFYWYQLERMSMETAFAESQLERLRNDFLESGSGDRFDVSLYQMTPFPRSHFARSGREQEMWAALFGEPDDETFRDVLRFAEVFNRTLKAHSIHLTLEVDARFPEYLMRFNT